MNRNKRFMAGAAALVVAAVGVAGLQGLANAYGPASVTLKGSLYLSNTPTTAAPTSNNSTTFAGLQLSQSPSDPNAGQSVTVTLLATSGPATGPVAVSANGQVVRSTVSVTGAQTATVTMRSAGLTCNYPASSVGSFSNLGGFTTTGVYTASGNGAASISLKQIFFDDQGDMDGSGPLAGETVCAGTANNADYYVSETSQIATCGNGSCTSADGLARTAPVNSSVAVQAFTITGPNGTILTSTGQDAGVQAARIPLPPFTGYANGGVTNIALSGTIWLADAVSGDFTAQFCNSAGTTCDTPSGSDTIVDNDLTTSAGGTLVGTVNIRRVSIGSPFATLTTGLRSIKIVQTAAAKTALVPVLILGTASVSASPASGGPGTVVTISGSNWNPLQTVTARGATNGVTPFVGGGGGGTYPTANSTDSPVTAAALTTGAFSVGGFVVQDVATIAITAKQGLGNAIANENSRAATGFTVNQDRCIAYTGDSTGGAGCNTKQNVNVSVLQGNLTQRVYVNAAATSGSSTSSASAPVVGTANTNSNETTVNLGTITTPLAPVVIAGTLNDITVSDNRGGTNGWSLTASGTSFTGVPSGTIAASALKATPSCAAATNSTAWDYLNAGKVAISGFDATLSAAGLTVGSAAQAFGSTVNLCTKDTTPNSTTGSTGGVYNVTSSLSLTVPAFQKAARYTAIVSITLA